MKVFISVSHHTCLLEKQIELIKKNISEDIEVFLIVGPYGGNNMTSSGNRVISTEVADSLGAELIHAPGVLSGIKPGKRYQAFLTWFLEEVLMPEEGLCLYLHSDCLPVRPMNINDLMDGNDMASRVINIPNREGLDYVYPTWMLIDMSKNPNFHDVDFSKITNMLVDEGKWKNVTHKGWGVTRMKIADMEEQMGDSFGYTDNLGFEWCTPGWLHVDKTTSTNEKTWNKKIDVLNKVFNTKFVELVEETLDLPNPGIKSLGPIKPPRIPGKMGAIQVKDPGNGPSLFRRLGNLSKAVVKHVSSGMKQVTPEQYKERLTVCSNCTFHNNAICAHANCGCFLSKKAWWESEKCPLETEEFPEGKWPKLDIVSKPDEEKLFD